MVEPVEPRTTSGLEETSRSSWVGHWRAHTPRLTMGTGGPIDIATALGLSETWPAYTECSYFPRDPSQPGQTGYSPERLGNARKFKKRGAPVGWALHGNGQCATGWQPWTLARWGDYRLSLYRDYGSPSLCECAARNQERISKLGSSAGLHRRAVSVPLGRLLVSVPCPQHGAFLEGPSRDLQA